MLVLDASATAAALHWAAGLAAQALPSLEDLVLGLRPADDARTRVFKSVGCARWDLAAARVAVSLAGFAR